MQDNKDVYTDDDQIDLKEVFNVLKRRAKTIFIGTGAVILLAIVIMIILPDSYESYGILSFQEHKSVGDNPRKNQDGAMSIADYKKYSSVFLNEDLVNQFNWSKSIDTNSIFSEESLMESFTPVYIFESKEKETDNNGILGLKITAKDSDPLKAHQKVTTLGAYIRTIITNTDIAIYHDGLRNELPELIAKNKISILSLELDRKDLLEKEELLQEKFKLYGLGNTEKNQVIDVDEKTEKYLSPKQQLVAIQVELKNIELQIKRLLRKNEVYQLLQRYVSFFNKSEENITTKDLLSIVELEKKRFFDQDSLTTDIEREALLTLEKTYRQITKNKKSVYTFLAAPTIPTEPVKKHKLIILVSISILSFFGFMFLVLFLDWWKSSK